MTSNKEIKDWYNTFTVKQKKTGVNLRHYTIVNSAVKAGLKKSDSVLEVGCGIGTLTGLLAKYLKKGTLMATDISDESVKIAREGLKSQKNLAFEVTDMSNFEHEEAYHFIILPDVMEHIPVEQHPSLFKTLAKSLKARGKILINIPHPKYISYLHEHEPEKLQIVDQALLADQLMRDAYAGGLSLIYYKSYNIFNESHDYVSILLEKDHNDQTYMDRSKLSIILDKFKLRFKY